MSSPYHTWLVAKQANRDLRNISDSDITTIQLYLNENFTTFDVTERLIIGKTPSQREKARRKTFILIQELAPSFADVHAYLVDLTKELVRDLPMHKESSYLRIIRDMHERMASAILSGSAQEAPLVSSRVTRHVALRQKEWTNFHTFQARCVAAQTLQFGEGEFFHAAKESLEVDSINLSPRSRMYALACVAWLVHALEVLLEACLGGIWSDGTGLARWNGWMLALEKISKLVDEEEGVFVGETVGVMERAGWEYREKRGIGHPPV